MAVGLIELASIVLEICTISGTFRQISVLELNPGLNGMPQTLPKAVFHES